MEGHPEDEHPLGESSPVLTHEERRTIAILAGGLLVAILLVPLVSLSSLSPLGNVFLGLSPLIVTLILSLVAVSAKYKRTVLWFILGLVHLAGLGLLSFLNRYLVVTINVPEAVSVSVFIGAIITLLAWLSESPPAHEPYRRPPPQTFTPEALPEFVQSIEDKCKALNFAIGRVYRNSNGGSPKLRERLRIPRDWYNEFQHADADQRVVQAHALIGKIHDRLLLYKRPEHEAFSKTELPHLKKLKRAADGSTPVIEVLSQNDSDPVAQYYQAALETCEQVLEGLGTHHNPYKAPPDSHGHQ